MYSSFHASQKCFCLLQSPSPLMGCKANSLSFRVVMKGFDKNNAGREKEGILEGDLEPKLCSLVSFLPI